MWRCVMGVAGVQLPWSHNNPRVSVNYNVDCLLLLIHDSIRGEKTSETKS